LFSAANDAPHRTRGRDQMQSNTKKHIPQEMNHEQVKRLLKFVDSSQSEAVKESIFSQLGYECFHARNLDKWIGQYTEDVRAFLDYVNVDHKSRYWERLEFNADRTALVLTGKKVLGCACVFADCAQPPRALCEYCCKSFQEELFGMLLGHKVEVEITAAYLFGDERCNTVIHIV
jgi:hypothetical protein